jgi:hypothetical protein
MAVNLSPVGGVAAQFFDNAGNVLTGGKLDTYLAGTTTPQPTYTTALGTVPWSNPIILDAAGRVSGSGEIWLTDGIQYKFILRDSNDVLIATYDNINGINSNFVAFTNQQEIQTATAGQTVFNLATMQYSPGTNSLSVFVDGVNQYGPGAQYAYFETDADTVTFVNGLHVGALVKFTTSQLNSSGGTTAAQVSYTPLGVGAISTNVQDELQKTYRTSNYATFTDAVTAANNNTLIVDSNITISINTTVPATVALICEYPFEFTIATGATLTINGLFNAGVHQVFNCVGTATVVFDRTKTLVGYPEWWGADTTSAADSTAAILASFVACPTTQLQAADYFVATTLQLNTSGRTIRGAGPFYNGVNGDSTRVISLSGTANVITVGPSSQPALINDFTSGITIENLQVSRAATPNIASGCAGILSRWTLYQKITNVKSVESISAFHYLGTVACYTSNCWAFRSVAGAGAGTDYWYGFYVDGTVGIPASGGNASIYFSDTNSNNVASLGVNSSGFYVNSNWADTSLTNPEVTGCAIGINIQGVSSATFGFGETDFNIIKPVIDNFLVAGIYVNNMSRYGTLSIVGGFAAPGGVGTPTGTIYVNNSLGAVAISEFQHILGSNTSITGGLVIVNSKNVTSINNAYLECSGIPVILSTADNCVIMDRALNNSFVSSAALQMTASNANKLEMTCSGAANKFGLGYQALSTANGRNEFNCTGLDSSCITSGSVNKLTINGVSVTTTGLSGTNLVSGVMT